MRRTVHMLGISAAILAAAPHAFAGSDRNAGKCVDGLHLAWQALGKMSDPVKKAEAKGHFKLVVAARHSASYQTCVDELGKVAQLTQ